MKKYNDWKTKNESMQDPLASMGKRVFGAQGATKLGNVLGALEDKPMLKQKLMAAQSVLGPILTGVEDRDLMVLKTKIINFLKNFQKTAPQ